jgi:hypothetical protein
MINALEAGTRSPFGTLGRDVIGTKLSDFFIFPMYFNKIGARGSRFKVCCAA